MRIFTAQLAARLLLILPLITVTVHANTPWQSNADFDQQRAVSAMLTAKTPVQFDRATHVLEKIILQGARNSTLFYDYGTMLLLSGHPKAALSALIRAERYSGTNWEIRHNMLLATDKIEDSFNAPHLPWYRVPLFWHYGLSARTRLTIACSAFLLICLTLLLPKNHRKESFRRLLSLEILLFMLFGSSALTTIYQEAHTASIIKFSTGIPSQAHVQTQNNHKKTGTQNV